MRQTIQTVSGGAVAVSIPSFISGLELGYKWLYLGAATVFVVGSVAFLLSLFMKSGSKKTEQPAIRFVGEGGSIENCGIYGFDQPILDAGKNSKIKSTQIMDLKATRQLYPNGLPLGLENPDDGKGDESR